MLTRLYVDGFKNLRDTEIRFGPLTCIAGGNGVGKSNVFDAIRFLSGLSDRSLMEAASGVRGGERLENLFGRDGDHRMVLECDMLIPATGVDEFNQPAEATDTWLTYRRLLQLEPSALRRPDELHAPAVMSSDGQHLPALLHRLAQDQRVLAGRPAGVLEAELANRLAELVEDVRAVRVERDEVRQVLQLVMEDRGGVVLPAASLSDGTLRFIALAALERDPEGEGVLCLEEPENGIHPGRISAMLQLLRDIAVDPTEPADEANPLRQVIVTTHSPLVARGVRGDELVLASRQDVRRDGGRLAPGLVFRGLERTWRAKPWQDGGSSVEVVALPTLCAYLEADGDAEFDREGDIAADDRLTVRKHVEQLQLEFTLGAAE